jgi:ferredoxin-thioredoxin reductase catalytic chain
MKNIKPSKELVEKFYRHLKEDAEQSGYHLNPDEPFTKDLVEALLINSERYGYPSCPCRLADGTREEDLDIICPCDYRDPDLTEFDSCYCALYVSDEVLAGIKEVEQIPDRRLVKEERNQKSEGKIQEKTIRRPGDETAELPYPVYRCRVCGYLCARDEPPDKCPVCGADKDRFARFI